MFAIPLGGSASITAGKRLKEQTKTAISRGENAKCTGSPDNPHYDAGTASYVPRGARSRLGSANLNQKVKVL
jgi:hypothetical protein